MEGICSEDGTTVSLASSSVIHPSREEVNVPVSPAFAVLVSVSVFTDGVATADAHDAQSIDNIIINEIIDTVFLFLIFCSPA